MKKLNEIKYNFVIDLTKYFVNKFNKGEIKDLNLIVRNVKLLAKFVQDMSFTYDETIWPPNSPETIKDLIEFKVQLRHSTSYLPFKLFISKGENQEAIMLNENIMWQ